MGEPQTVASDSLAQSQTRGVGGVCMMCCVIYIRALTILPYLVLMELTISTAELLPGAIKGRTGDARVSITYQ